MEDFHRYIYFYTKDSTGVYTTSGYTLPITPFTFIPVFDDGLSVDYSKQNILWDFGDGEKTTEISPTHHFKVPGWYNVKCYVLGKGGEGYVDSFSQNILVRDFISDTIVISGSNGKTESGTLQNPFEIFRFNSWQTYEALSSDGYSIHLSVSGNIAPFLDAEAYKKDKWGHLKATSRFETLLYNPITEKEERLPINKIRTSNVELYVRYIDNKLTFCNKEDVGSCFAGTSGRKVFYFIDDIPKKLDDFTEITAITILASFDYAKFKDYNTINKTIPDSIYSVLNNIYNCNSFSNIIEQLDSDHLTITSNGIDDDNNGNLIDTFDIYPQKYTDQKIGFVVKCKSTKNGKVLSSKYNPIFELTNNLYLTGGQINIELRDNFNNKINGINFVSNMGVLSTEKYGGFFKGYFTSNNPLNDVHIFARGLPVLQERYLIDTNYAIIGNPQSDKIHNLVIKTDIDNPSVKSFTDNLFSTQGLTGIYTSCIVSDRNKNTGETTYNAWVVDADREKIKRYNITANGLNLIYENFDIPLSSSPSNIVSDKLGNVWVTLYDAISSIRINSITNLIDKVIVPSVVNTVISGENTVSPASIDTDIEDNIWISYSTEYNSFVEKYDSNGNFLLNYTLTPNYQATEIITDIEKNVWIIAKDLITNTKTLSTKNDKIIRLDEDGNLVQQYNVNGSLWNITTDARRNIWVTRNIDEVVYINSNFHTLSVFSLNSPNNFAGNYISDLEGIACTAPDNTILVIDNRNNKIHYFNADIQITNLFVPRSFSLERITYDYVPYQNKTNGYGDWNGFKHINKYHHIFPAIDVLEGRSNTFSIFDSSSASYDIEKINENYDPKEQTKSYIFQEYLLDKPKVFDNFLGSSLGTLSSNPMELGKLVYEKISNFTDNIANIDICNIKALKSMYEMLDEDFYSFNDYNYSVPFNILRLMDMFSINFSKLKGSRNKYNQNFDDKGYHNDIIRQNNGIVLYGFNKGDELNFNTSILTAGDFIIAYEIFSETYRLVSTDLLSSNFVNFIDPINKTYALSSYHPNWGWGLVLPDVYTNNKIPRYYKFYKFISDYNDLQTEGLINWSSTNTTISENLSSVQDWDNIKQNILLYYLAKGLEVIK
jgi:hypothetical protein